MGRPITKNTNTIHMRSSVFSPGKSNRYNMTNSNRQPICTKTNNSSSINITKQRNVGTHEVYTNIQ